MLKVVEWGEEKTTKQRAVKGGCSIYLSAVKHYCKESMFRTFAKIRCTGMRVWELVSYLKHNKIKIYCRIVINCYMQSACRDTPSKPDKTFFLMHAWWLNKRGVAVLIHQRSKCVRRERENRDKCCVMSKDFFILIKK